VLRDTFGFGEFLPLQAEVIDTVIGGGNAIAVMPTGGGKSLCYQIPSLVRAGTGVVVSPLIALMKDQVDALRQFGVRAAYLNSSLSFQERQRTERELAGGAVDILYMAPEGLLTDAGLDLLAGIEVALFAIDEAHCVSRWGHDFRPEYMQLSKLAERFPGVPRIALTATADEMTRRDIAAELRLADARMFVASFVRPNLNYTISEARGAGPKQDLLRFITDRHPGDAGIVYCMSRRDVEETAAWLCDNNLRALPYHAGLDTATRARHQEAFMREDGVIVVATTAFGMGINKPDVRFVAHLNLPKNIESYYQETGRAGRDGAPASAWMRYGFGDVITLLQWLRRSEADEEFKRIERGKIYALLGLCETAGCRRKILINYFGEDYPDACGNCDNCLAPPETWDATLAAQKALSCAYRTGQRFGAAHLIDVLLGKDTDKIRRFRHHNLSVHGIGAEHTAAEWNAAAAPLDLGARAECPAVCDFPRQDAGRHGAAQTARRGRPPRHLRHRGSQTATLRRGVFGGDCGVRGGGVAAFLSRRFVANGHNEPEQGDAHHDAPARFVHCAGRVNSTPFLLLTVSGNWERRRFFSLMLNEASAARHNSSLLRLGGLAMTIRGWESNFFIMFTAGTRSPSPETM